MLRENELTKYIPVVFLTGVNNKDKVTEALKMNPVEYILKPVTQEKLMEVSEGILESLGDRRFAYGIFTHERLQ